MSWSISMRHILLLTVFKTVYPSTKCVVIKVFASYKSLIWLEEENELACVSFWWMWAHAHEQSPFLNFFKTSTKTKEICFWPINVILLAFLFPLNGATFVKKMTLWVEQQSWVANEKLAKSSLSMANSSFCCWCHLFVWMIEVWKKKSEEQI